MVSLSSTSSVSTPGWFVCARDLWRSQQTLTDQTTAGRDAEVKRSTMAETTPDLYFTKMRSRVADVDCVYHIQYRLLNSRPTGFFSKRPLKTIEVGRRRNGAKRRCQVNYCCFIDWAGDYRIRGIKEINL